MKKTTKKKVSLRPTVTALKREVNRLTNELLLRSASVHDLGLKTENLYEENGILRAAGIKREALVKEMLAYISTRPDAVNPKADQAYVRMVEMCREAGITPMSPEMFAKEDARLITDWNRRRHGIDDSRTPDVNKYIRPGRVIGLNGSPCIQYVPTLNDRVPFSFGWFWRIPYGWILRAGRFFRTGD